MTRRALPWLVVATIGFVVIVALAPIPAATGWRLAFVTAGAPIAGAVLLLLIARVTGADWPWFAPLASAAPLLVIGAVGIGVIQLAVPPPVHLGLWQQPIAVGIRAVLAAGAIAWVGVKLMRNAGVTFAAAALAIYAILSTAIGSDWLLGGTSGHAVSAIGMMLATQQIGAACAAVLLIGWGDERFRRDMGKLLVAAGLGLSYMIFMDFLILWYGDVPAKIGWYVDRATPLLDIVVMLALVCGLCVPIAAQALIGVRNGQRIAGASALVGLALIDLWWVDAGLLALLAALCAGVMLVTGAAMLIERRRAHD